MHNDDKNVIEAISKVLYIAVFSCHPSFVYRIESGKHKGQMTESQLNQVFLAETYKEAVGIAVNWTRNRYNEVYQDFFKDSEIGCLKINVKFIGRADKNGQINTRNGMTFFEWKYDWGYSLDDAVKEFARNRHADTHPFSFSMV